MAISNKIFYCRKSIQDLKSLSRNITLWQERDLIRRIINRLESLLGKYLEEKKQIDQESNKKKVFEAQSIQSVGFTDEVCPQCKRVYKVINRFPISCPFCVKEEATKGVFSNEI